MNNIDQIIIISDPRQRTPDEEFEAYDMSIGELLDITNEFGDSYFMVGSTVAIYTKSGTHFTAVKIDEGKWEFAYELYDEYTIIEHKGTLYEALDKIEKTDKDIRYSLRR